VSNVEAVDVVVFAIADQWVIFVGVVSFGVAVKFDN